MAAKPGEKWGGKTKNGTWNGMVGMLVRDEIDFSAIGCGINQQGRDSIGKWLEKWLKNSMKIGFSTP